MPTRLSALVVDLWIGMLPKVEVTNSFHGQPKKKNRIFFLKPSQIFGSGDPCFDLSSCRQACPAWVIAPNRIEAQPNRHAGMCWVGGR
jgi:hypothetical protein